MGVSGGSILGGYGQTEDDFDQKGKKKKKNIACEAIM